MVYDFSEYNEHDDNSILTSSTHPNQSFSRVLKLLSSNCVIACAFTQKRSLYRL